MHHQEALLIVFELEIASSYGDDTEVEATTERDTVQFLLVGDAAWRFRTYALDHDVHGWTLGAKSRTELESLAHENTEKHYGDVVGRTFTIEGQCGVPSLATALRANGNSGALEVYQSGAAAFWVPSADIYRSRSTPE